MIHLRYNYIYFKLFICLLKKKKKKKKKKTFLLILKTFSTNEKTYKYYHYII